MKEEIEKQAGLPDNAFRPLKPGEKYHPLMSPEKIIRKSICGLFYGVF